MGIRAEGFMGIIDFAYNSQGIEVKQFDIGIKKNVK